MHTSTFKNACIHTLTYQHMRRHTNMHTTTHFSGNFYEFSFTSVTKLLTRFPQYTKMIHWDWVSST